MSKSTIIDADIAEESAQLIKQRILQQNTASLLNQASNINSQAIMGLINI